VRLYVLNVLSGYLPGALGKELFAATSSGNISATRAAAAIASAADMGMLSLGASGSSIHGAYTGTEVMLSGPLTVLN
jgi:hypothetical protein